VQVTAKGEDVIVFVVLVAIEVVIMLVAAGIEVVI